MKEDLYLKKLEENDKDIWLEFWEDSYKTGNMSEERWKYTQSVNWPGKLFTLKKNETEKSPLYNYYLVENGKLIGRLVIRLNPELLPIDTHDGSHISYMIIPSKRGQGYGTEMLRLGLEKCKELKQDEVIVSCNVDNIGSSKVIENNCGKLICIEPCSVEKGKMSKRYKIKVEEALSKKCLK